MWENYFVLDWLPFIYVLNKIIEVCEQTFCSWIKALAEVNSLLYDIVLYSTELDIFKIPFILHIPFLYLKHKI